VGFSRFGDEHAAEEALEVVALGKGGGVAEDANEVGAVFEEVGLGIADEVLYEVAYEAKRSAVAQKEDGLVLGGGFDGLKGFLLLG